MKTEVDQALGNVSGFYSILRLQTIAEHDLVHRSRFVRQVVDAFKLLANVVGVEHCVFGSLTQAVGTVGEDIGQRTHEHTEVAVEGAHATNGFWAVVLEPKFAIWTSCEYRARQEWLEKFLAR